MKYIQSFKQYESQSFDIDDLSINEGVVYDFVQKQFNNIKSFVAKELEKATGSLENIKKDLSEYEGLTFKQIYQKLQDKYKGTMRNEFGEEQVWQADETGKPMQYSVNRNPRTTRPYTKRPNAGEFGENVRYTGRRLNEEWDEQHQTTGHGKPSPEAWARKAAAEKSAATHNAFVDQVRSKTGKLTKITTDLFGYTALGSFITTAVSGFFAINPTVVNPIMDKIAGTSGIILIISVVIYAIMSKIFDYR